MAILPGLFNINEPVIYGYPIVFNLPLMIPFVLVPDLFIAVTYGLTCAGIIAPCVVQVPWTTPAVISAFLTTGGDIRAAGRPSRSPSYPRVTVIARCTSSERGSQ